MRMKNDRETGPDSVLDKWHGKYWLGHAEWNKTRRIALWDYLEDARRLTPENEIRLAELPEKKRANAKRRYIAEQKKQKLAEMRADLRARGIKCVIILETLSRQQEDHSLTGTTVWDEFGWSESLSANQGTIQRDPDGFWVLPILNPGNYDHVYSWLIRRWMRWGLQAARGKLGPIEWPAEMYTEPSEASLALLRRIAQSPSVAVDIEAYTPGKLITAIGVASERGAVSVPWDSFHTPSGALEPGWCGYEYGPAHAELIRQILSSQTTKIFHNMAFDVVELERREIKVVGPIEDTLAMHQEIYNQFRHGLQIACATEFLVEPWKSLHQSDDFKKSDPDFWIERPQETRAYNCKDSFATWLLAKSLMGKLG